MSVDRDTVRRVATLARLSLPEDQLDALSGELNKILSWIDQLNEVDTEGVEPMAAVTPMTLRRRTDNVTDGALSEDVLANAPDPQAKFFAVPKVLE